MKEALGSSETSVLTRATRRSIPETPFFVLILAEDRRDFHHFLQEQSLFCNHSATGRAALCCAVLCRSQGR
jgi:hypothetical protein